MCILVKDLKRGQVFWECEYGTCIEYIALEDARYIHDPEDIVDGWECYSSSFAGDVVNFYQHHEITHYGPKLYKYEAYQRSTND